MCLFLPLISIPHDNTTYLWQNMGYNFVWYPLSPALGEMFGANWAAWGVHSSSSHPWHQLQLWRGKCLYLSSYFRFFSCILHNKLVLYLEEQNTRDWSSLFNIFSYFWTILSLRYQSDNLKKTNRKKTAIYLVEPLDLLIFSKVCSQALVLVVSMTFQLRGWWGW